MSSLVALAVSVGVLGGIAAWFFSHSWLNLDMGGIRIVGMFFPFWW